MPSGSAPMSKYKANVTAYKKVQGDYQVLAAIIEQALQRACRELGIQAIIQVRSKELASFAEKSIRKEAEYPDPVNMMNDLCGARVITESTNDIGPVCAFIRKHFEVDETTTEDTARRLGLSEFGYRSVHFTVALRPDDLQDDIAKVLAHSPEQEKEAVTARLLGRRTADDCKGHPFGPGPRFRAEIQVRSLLQHAWANLYHDRVYKSEFQLPTDLKRGLIRMAAILEDADEQFAQAISTIDGYRDYFGTYLPPDRLADEFDKLQAIRVFDRGSLKLALKAARIAVLMESWPEVDSILGGFVRSWEDTPVTEKGIETTRGASLDAAMLLAASPGASSGEQRRARQALEEFRDTQRANLLLDYGTAQWHLKNPERARMCLERASGLDLTSAHALIALADTYDADDAEQDVQRSLQYYRQAFEINPLEPRAVCGYLRTMAELRPSLDFAKPMRLTILKAIQCCRQRIGLGIYLPWAYFDMGFFFLLLGEPSEGLESYAKAVELSHSGHPIETALRHAHRLEQTRRADEAVRSDQLPREASEWFLLEYFLTLVKAASAGQHADSGAATGAISHPVEPAITALKKMSGSEDRTRTAGKPKASDRTCPTLRDNVVIVAGGCAPGDEGRLRQYEPLLVEAFGNFDGTIFSGGTRSGISEIVGNLPPSSRGPILKVACLPKDMPGYHREHESYQCYRHPGRDFSALGVVQVWADILCQRIRPSSVCVFGIGGGKLAGFEYRLALAMGAKVGVLEGSGRAADAILTDPDWMDHPNLIPLPYDPQTVKLFVAGFSSGAFDEKQREEAARSQHERNVAKRKRESVVDGRPENQPWETLRPDLKASILERVDFIFEQLHAVGLRAVKPDQVPPGVKLVTEFTPDQVEIMAEMEHARWCVRKFLDGWRLGKTKDDAQRTHPDLIAWKPLLEQEREKDRHYARQISSVLREQGYAIVPGETAQIMPDGTGVVDT